MKYGLVSDLHLEQYTITGRDVIIDKLNFCDADHLLIAGDICNGLILRDFILSSLHIPYTFVRGNHDFRGQQLVDDSGVDGDVTFATLWSDFRNNPATAKIVEADNRDFKTIRRSPLPDDFIRSSDVATLFIAHTTFIANNRNKIVMTHFAPSTKSRSPSVSPKNPVLPYYVNDIPDAFIEDVAQIWVHGHVHSPVDYMVGNTRVLSNPLGYPTEIYSDVREYEVKVFEI